MAPLLSQLFPSYAQQYFHMTIRDRLSAEACLLAIGNDLVTLLHPGKHSHQLPTYLKHASRTKVSMDYRYEHGDQESLIARLGPHFTSYDEPLDAQVALSNDPAWEDLRLDLQLAGNRLLRLELEEDERSSAQVILGESRRFGEPNVRLKRLAAEEQKLWQAVAAHPTVPESMEAVVRDLLLSTGANTSPANAERVIDLYRVVAQGPRDSLHVGLAILRANTIARSRSMPVEASIREEVLILAERALTTNVLPGICLRHAGAVAESPRMGSRASDEVRRLATVLNYIAAKHHDESTLDWITKYRLAVAETAEERDAVRRRHVQQFITFSDNDTVPFRAMIWAEKAVALASDYGFQDLHDTAVLRMQKLSRTDLGWHRSVTEIKIPTALFRQEERLIARLSSWEQALALFLASDSPSGNSEKNKKQAADIRPGILEVFSGRTFGSHQLPERTHGPAELENLAKIVQTNLHNAAMTLRVRLDAIPNRFGTPDEDTIVTVLSTLYGSAPQLVQPFAQALRLYWSGDPSSAARLAVPLIETGARELLFLMDQPLYRMERGASPGRFPAMDFYVDKLDSIGLDPDWVMALRGALLSGGMNLRNRLAHGFKLDFSADEAALVLRLAGLFIGMPVGIDAIIDERVRTPLVTPRKPLHRRLGWIWR